MTWPLVRHDLDTVNGQVAVDATALDNDTTKLDGAKTALAHASTDLSLENLAVAGLHTCLGGVEQALNALATGDQTGRVGAGGRGGQLCRRRGYPWLLESLADQRHMGIS